MRQKKILFGLLLAFALLLGGAYALYTRLGQSMAPGRLAGAEPAASESASGSASQRTPAPDFTVYDGEGNEVHLTFLPLRPDCGNDPQWEDWNCYRSILTIGWPDCERLLIPALRQLFPVKDPTNGEVQEEFDLCFDNWIGKEDWERWILLVRDSLLSMTAEEAAFLRSILEWMETALTHTSAMIVESNL